MKTHPKNTASAYFKNTCQELNVLLTAFLIQIFLRWQKIADVNSDILSSRRQMSKSRRQICFLLLAHYQPTTLLRQAGNLLLESFGTLISIMIT